MRQASQSGSSPLARGLRCFCCSCWCGRRIIPARAGFTQDGRPERWTDADHPRSRGVYRHLWTSPSGPPGSSPLARGLLFSSIIRASFRGIIPARAGFTAAVTSISYMVGDHPRSRGVYQGDELAHDIEGGSSPLARGLRHGSQGLVVKRRIIPARAGFTPMRRPGRGAWTDHPRSRGVYFAATMWLRDLAGSSPLARGLRGVQQGRTWGAPDHPRSRGVYPPGTPRMMARRGSSPLARGLRRGMRSDRISPRIIPARAGFTAGARGGNRGRSDHPRSRGVYVHGRQDHGLGQGSSPLARGLLGRGVAQRELRGIIPARAGFTPSARGCM